MASQALTPLLPELALDTTTRLERLTHLANRAWNDIRRLVAVSTVEDTHLSSNHRIIFVQPARWAPLPAEQQPLADAASTSARAWLEAAERVLQLNEASALREHEQHSQVLRGIVDRSAAGTGLPPAIQLTKVTRAAEEAIIAQLDLLQGLASARQPPHWMWLPDTNALYDRHELHRWPASRPTLLVVAPAVIMELDTHKQDGRNPDRREKARTLILQIKDIRRRADQVINGKLRLHFTGTWQQHWEAMPTWLDPGHADDQILALGIELSWTSPSSAVTVVTSDANLQIKAERVGLAYVDQDVPSALVAPTAPGLHTCIYRARRALIYAGYHRNPGDRFLAVDGEEAILRAHLEQGAAEVA
jgi:hypothetical protein